ncbi:MAG: radical SAM protein [Polyangiales bacterium]
MSARRVTVRLRGACDNACAFCAQHGAPALDDLDDVALRDALTAARAVADEVTFVGGEPTGHPGLARAVTLARELGFYRVGVQTHGRALAVDGLASTLAAAGLTDVHASLHGGPASHDHLVGVEGAHAGLLAGVDAARGAGLTVVATTVLTRSNFRDLLPVVTELSTRGAAAWCITAPHAAGSALRDFDRVLPRLALAVPFALHALEAARRARLTGWIRGVPLCLLGPFAARALPDAPRAYGAPCERCGVRARCSGVDAMYLARFRGDELSPRASAPDGTSTDHSLARMFVGAGELWRPPEAAPRRTLPLFSERG